MARQPRIEFEGAFYHVSSRGNLRENIFFDDSDREKFIDILKRTKERYRYILHAYVLMDNHYHLLVETPLANLNQLMQNINTSYSVFINRKYRRSGHLFQGRYKSIVVDKNNYLLLLSRYIHLNPVRAGIVNIPEDYKWSSYKGYIAHIRNGLVETTDTLSYISNKIRLAKKEYKRFVESGIIKEEYPFKDARKRIILGGEGFIEKVEEFIKDRQQDQEITVLRKFQTKIPIDNIVKTVSEYYHLNGIDLRRKTRRYAKQRKAAIYLTKVINTEKNPVVARYFGITPQGVSNVITEVEAELEKSNSLKRKMEELRRRLDEEM